MKRRSFLKAGSVAPLSAAVPLGSRFVEAAEQTGQGMVENVENRYYYLNNLLYALSTRLGPRPVGTESFKRGIEIIQKEMESSLPEVFLDEFSIDSWELDGEPRMTVGGKAIETFPHHGCLGTPKVGARGILKEKASASPFSIVERTTGEILADINISPYGPAIPSNALREGVFREIPIFGVGKYDHPVLEQAAKDGSRVYASADVKITRNVPSWSSVGSIPGKTKKEILVVAHADTVYTSPGANDNTASVIVMLMMAHELAKTEHDYTLTFLASGSEEYGGYLGAKSYAKRRKEAGTYENIKYVLQFDSLTYGPDFLLNSSDTGLRNLVESINDELAINGKPRHSDSGEWVMDASPFEATGARAIFVNSRGYDGITLPVYHRAEDTPVTVAFDCVDNSFRVFTEFVKRLQTL